MSKKRKARDTEVVPAADQPPTDPHIPVAEPVPTIAEAAPSEPSPTLISESAISEPSITELHDVETTVNLRGADLPELPLRDDAADEADEAEEGAPSSKEGATKEGISRDHLKGLCEALVFASDRPLKPSEIARNAHAPTKVVKEILAELEGEYRTRGIHLGEVAGGWTFRTNVQYAPFVRDLSAQKPVRLTRAQVETLAIIAYRQPVTRPEIDDVRGVDSGPVLRMLLERDLVRILGKKDEPGRPILYGTGHAFLELFGLKSLKDLPTLREFTDLNEESRRVVERELGEVMETKVDVEADGAVAEPGADPERTVAYDASETIDAPVPEPSGSANDVAPATRVDAEPAEERAPSAPDADPSSRDVDPPTESAPDLD